MSSLVCSQLGFSWPDGEVVLDDLTVTFPDGRTGLIGDNGSGKSTLLRLLVGDLTPTTGTVSGPTDVGYLPQQLVLDACRTVADVLGVAAPLAALDRIVDGVGTATDFDVLGDRWDVDERALAVLTDLGFTAPTGAGARWLDPTIGALSGGEVVLLGVAALFLDEPAVLLLDEPTNNLDPAARTRLQQSLQRWRRPAIVVSHDLELLDRMDAIVELRDAGVRVFGGPYSAYVEALRVEQEAAQRDVRAAQTDLRRQRRELAQARVKLDRRQRYARGQADNVPAIVAGAKKRAAQVSAGKLRGDHENEVGRAERALTLAQEQVRDDDLIRVDLPQTAVPAGREVARLEDVTLRHGLTVSLHLRGPERVGLVGPNGVGKTTLIRTLAGQLAPLAGSVRVGVPVRVLPQRLQVLDDEASVLAAVSQEAPGADDNTLRASLARFRLDADLVQRRVGSLSGGERFRATLAALLLARPAPQLLIVDEPTNNLDLDSVAQLVAALRSYRGALLVSSHDRRFLDRLDLDRVMDLGAPDLPATP